MNIKKCILPAVIFILLASQLTTAARPRCQTRSSRQRSFSGKMAGPAKEWPEYSLDRLATNACLRKLLTRMNGEPARKHLGAYLTKKEKRGLLLSLESQVKIVWPECEESMELRKSTDQRQYKQIKELLGRRYADRWAKKRAAERQYWAAIQKKRGGI